MRTPGPVLAAAVALALAGCGDGVSERGEPTPTGPPAATSGGGTPATEAAPPKTVDAVLYGIGLSTDPYGESRPGGIGIVTGLASGMLHREEIRDDDLGWFGPPGWIDETRVVASRRGPPFAAPSLVAVRDGELDPIGPAPLRDLEPVGRWSPDGRLVATEPIARCGPRQGFEECYRQSGVVFVVDAEGARRRVGPWHLGGWTPDGRLLVTDERGEEYLALDLETGRAEAVIDRAAVARLAGKERVGVGRPIWSADGRYVAALAGVAWGRRSGTVGTVVVARGDGTPVRLLTSPFIVSMLAWSPAGHRLAFTTSGFPDPHELFVLEEPDGEPRRLFATGARHVDWVTWSPDGRFLLLDDGSYGGDPLRPHRPPPGRWLLLDADDGRVVRELPRFGGAPQWCCPAGPYVTLNG